MPRARALLALLAAAAAPAALSACGSSAGQGGTAAVVSLARAADVTARAGGAQVAISGGFEVPGIAHIGIGGGGHFNLAGHEGELAMTLSGLPSVLGGGGALGLQERLKGDTVYVSSPLLSGHLPGGARWVKVDVGRVGQGLGLDPSSLASGGLDPAQYLQTLRAAGATPTVVGHEPVRGVETTRYRAEIDLQKLAQQQGGGAKVHEALAQIGVSQLPVEAWVDAQGRVRRVAIALHPTVQGQGAGVRIVTEYFGFGPTPVVTPPPPSEVFDVTGQTLQGLSGLGV
jgi:hypothetical protein